MVKKERVVYKCLSEKDKVDLKKWNSNKKINKGKKTKGKPKLNLNTLADELREKSYQTFLSSRYWNIVREMVLKRDGGMCRICKVKYNLQIHHDNYKNHFREHLNLSDLVTLCGSCHTVHHHCTD